MSFWYIFSAKWVFLDFIPLTLYQENMLMDRTKQSHSFKFILMHFSDITLFFL